MKETILNVLKHKREYISLYKMCYVQAWLDPEAKLLYLSLIILSHFLLLLPSLYLSFIFFNILAPSSPFVDVFLQAAKAYIILVDCNSR